MTRIILTLTLASGLLLAAPRPSVRLGVDRLFEGPYWNWIQGKRIGLITNLSALDTGRQSTLNRLKNHPQVRLVALFAPEHGVSGREPAGHPIAGSARVHSLYGPIRAPTPAMLEPLDVLVYDLQDVGVRFYTYISTLYLSMEAAGAHGIPFIVLDRPNPIQGSRVEGPLLEPAYRSFLGIFPLPVRYGLTPGELALFFNQEAHLGADLRVVPLLGWQRQLWYDQTGLLWTPPSPNLPRLETAMVYPGFCLVEGTNLSEGRGTAHPFEIIGAPWLDSRQVADGLNQLELPGIRFSPETFVPAQSKYSGQQCHGIRLRISDRTRFLPLKTALHFLATVRGIHGARLVFESTLFDRLAGNSWLREGILQDRPVESLVERWQQPLAQFRERRQRYLLYGSDSASQQ